MKHQQRSIRHLVSLQDTNNENVDGAKPVWVRINGHPSFSTPAMAIKYSPNLNRKSDFFTLKARHRWNHGENANAKKENRYKVSKETEKRLKKQREKISLGNMGNIGTPSMENPAMESFRGLRSLASSPEETLVDLLMAAILLIWRDLGMFGDREPITATEEKSKTTLLRRKNTHWRKATRIQWMREKRAQDFFSIFVVTKRQPTAFVFLFSIQREARNSKPHWQDKYWRHLRKVCPSALYPVRLTPQFLLSGLFSPKKKIITKK